MRREKDKKESWSYTPFEGLQEIIKERQRDKAPAETGPPDRGKHCTGRHAHPAKSDEEIFLEAMAGVRRIEEFRNLPIRMAKRRPSARPRRDVTHEVLRDIVEGRERIRLCDTGEYMEWANPALKGNIARRLHEGGFAVQDSIDLHGMTLHEAEEAFFNFFRTALRDGKFCIKVIHGRGLKSPSEPVLRNAVRGWLQGRLRKRVYAFASARHCDGGLGATYILLRISRGS